jgi:hypothetical protein
MTFSDDRFAGHIVTRYFYDPQFDDAIGGLPGFLMPQLVDSIFATVTLSREKKCLMRGLHLSVDQFGWDW